MESIREPDGSEMMTVYHPDGSRLVMTHYCSSGNQPRMRAEGLSAEGKKLAFAYVDVTNLSSPDSLHMVRLAMTFDDANHFTEEWTSLEKGKDAEKFQHSCTLQVKRLREAAADRAGYLDWYGDASALERT